MIYRRYLSPISLVALWLSNVLGLRAAGLPVGEYRKIEALISEVERLKGATFLRNDRAYDAKTAGRFLRGKWRSQEMNIRSAEEFIARAATASMSSGRPYMLRMSNGTETECADYLRTRLARL